MSADPAALPPDAAAAPPDATALLGTTPDALGLLPAVGDEAPPDVHAASPTTAASVATHRTGSARTLRGGYGESLPRKTTAMGSILPYRRHHLVSGGNQTQQNPSHEGFWGHLGGDDYTPSLRHTPQLIRQASVYFALLGNDIRHEAHNAEFFLALRAKFRHRWP